VSIWTLIMLGGASVQLCWSVEALWGGESLGSGDGKTKKDAKKMAAFNALAVLGLPRPFTYNDCVARYRESSTRANQMHGAQ